MKLRPILTYLEEIAPLAFQEDYDNCGLLAGDPETEIASALVCLDLTMDVVREAVNTGCNLIIAHHPFLFKGVKRLKTGDPATDMIKAVIRNDLAVYAIHTCLDNAKGGLNDYLAVKLGLSKSRILSPKEGMLFKLVTFCPLEHAGKVREAVFGAGAGVIGNYDFCSFNLEGEGTFRASASANPFVGEIDKMHTERESRIEVIVPVHRMQDAVNALIRAHPYEEVAYDIYPLSNAYPQCGSGILASLPEPLMPAEFLAMVKEKLNTGVIKHSVLTEKPLEKVAICSGSGGFLIGEAVTAGADVFLTADLKYHDFMDWGGRILLADIGHYESEQWIKDFLKEKLIEKFPTFAVLSSGLNTNPVNYL
jgi:dinuclear metal center YbgI/SA1388 family protein